MEHLFKPNPPVPAGAQALRAYAARHGLDAGSLRPDGGLSVTFDDRYRVQVRPGGDGRVVASSLLVDLGTLAPQPRQELLARLASLACAVMRDHPALLAIDPAGRLLVEQVIPAAEGPALLDEALAGFVNLLPFWQAALTQEQGL